MVTPWWAENARPQPYSESRKHNTITRKFSIDVDDEELVWHRDHDERRVTVIEGSGWRLQMDNQLPTVLKQGDKFTIPENTYHRILKGYTDLVVEILEKK